MIIPEGEPDAIIDNTDDYTDTDDDDDNEEEIYKMTATDFIVQYLLQDEKFAEWIFNRNRWDEVEQRYDIERKKQLQPAHRQPVKCIGGTRYRFYLRQDTKQLQEIE